MSQLDPRRLATFAAVARAGSLSTASRILHLSQPAITAQIQQLEEQCGYPLFVRTARGVVLTDRGRVLTGYAGRVEALLEEAASAVGEQPAHQGPLVLGASTTIASYVLVPLLADFRRAVADVGIRVEVGNTAEVLEWVADERVPLGLVEGHSRAARLHLEHFLDDELVPVVASDAAAELRRVHRAEELRHLPIVWREPGSGSRAVIERALKRHLGRRRAHERDVQLGSTEAIKAAVLLGLGVGFLSRWSIQAETRSGRLAILKLRDLRVQRSFSWALRSPNLGGQAGRFYQHARRAPPALAAF